MRSFLAVRKFGMLLAQAERIYEKDWAESLPLDWRVRLADTPDFMVSDDGVTPPLLKLSPMESAEPSVKPASVGAAEAGNGDGGGTLAGQLLEMKICEEPR